MSNFNPVLLPIIRRIIPNIVATEIVGAQSTQMSTFETTSERKIDVHVCDESCDNGQWVHSFIGGWEKRIECPLYYGKPNITGYEFVSGDNIFSLKRLVDSGFHLNCEIPNMRFI